MRTLLAVAAGIALLQPLPARSATVAAGQRHTLAVTPDGRVWAWGDDRSGQLGLSGDEVTLPTRIPGLADAVQVAAGGLHSLILRRDGSVWALGSNAKGQLGVEGGSAANVPRRVTGLPGVVGVAAGDAYSVAWTARGDLFVWGANDRGQLGLGDRKPRSRPTRVEGLRAIAVAAGPESTFVLADDGHVRAFGRNDRGQLGLGHRKAGLAPATIPGLEGIVSVAAGLDYGASLDGTGSLRVWGATLQGPGLEDWSLRPEILSALSQSVVAIAAGRGHVLAITNTGGLWAWGGNARGQLGQGQRSGRGGLVEILVPHPIVGAAAGGEHTVVVTREGGVWAWGGNGAGQIGDGTREDALSPTEIAEAGYDWKVGRPAFVPPGGRYDSTQSVTVSSTTPDALIHYTTDGQEPDNSDPAVPSGGVVEVTRPTTVKARAVKPPAPPSNTSRARYELPSARRAGESPEAGTPELGLRKKVGGGGGGIGPLAVIAGENAGYGAVAGGYSHSLLLKPDGTIWSWGTNTYWELGDTTPTARYIPAQVAALSSIKAIEAGLSFSLALQTNGDLWVWGLNNQGQLGDGLTANRSVPYKVLTGVVAMAAGEQHVLAVKSDGTVWAWGRNNEGELGQGTTSTTPQRTPIQVPGLPAGVVTRVAAGQFFSLLLRDGTVRAWGYNGSGQLGQNDLTQRTSPTVVAGLSSIDSLSGGQDHVLALRSDGQVFAWGRNNFGQVGDGTSGTNRLTPVQLLECPPVVSISAGYNHSLAISETGVIYAWGQQSSGQVGDGTTATSRVSPVALDAPTDVAAIDAGQIHSLAISRDGSVWAWGSNLSGRLGDGTTQNRLAPVKIADAGFAWWVGAPTFTPPPAISPVDVTVTITSPTAGARLRYTIDGSEPTDGTTQPSVLLSASATLKAKAFKDGQPPSSTTSAFYELKVASPLILPNSGSFTTPQTVTITTTSTGVSLRYTTDGSAPTPTSTLYTAPFAIGTTSTVNATGFKTGWTATAGTAKTYTFNYGTATAPTVNPATGTYTDSVTVTMSAQAGATVRYTTDGSTPTASSTAYTAPVVLTSTTTITAKAFHPDYTTSAATSRIYTISLSGPVLTPGAGTYAIGQSVTLSAAAGTTIRYTFNGVDPTTTDTGVPSGTAVRLVASSTFRAKAFRTGATTSATTIAAYTVTGSVPNVAVDGGLEHSLAKLPTGGLWTWGSNLSGQLGDGTTTESLVPKLLSTPTNVSQAAAGFRHTLSVDASTARSWGGNTYGELGYATASSVPLPVSSLSATVVQVAAGQYLSLAVLADTNVWAWGRNNNGQLGQNTTNTVANSTPVHVKDPPGTGFLTGATAVAAGYLHSVALKSDGSVYAWGSNTYGQVGQTSGTTQKTLPIQVTGFPATVVAIAAGDYHTLALLSNGSVYGWGQNLSGQLGNGVTSSFNNVPVRCGTLTGVRAIAAGGSHSLVALNDGSLFGFGSNSNGQLGVAGAGANSSSPLRIDALSGIVSVGAGGSHSLAVDIDGQIWSFGRNAEGQLGDGTKIARSTPIRVADTSYNWMVGTPTLTPSGAAFYNNTQSVTVSTVTPGATIYYTTNGVDPTTSDPFFSNSSGVVSVGVSSTLKAKAYKTGLAPSSVASAVYLLKVAAVAAAPAGGSYNTDQTVALSSSSTSPTTIYYTTDGSIPTTSSAVYTTPLAVNKSMTLRAQGFKTGWDPTNGEIWVYLLKVATPALSPVAGSYASPQTVIVTTTTPLATLRYTLDGATPNGSSPVVPGGGVSVTQSTILSVKGFKAGWTDSDLITGTYVISTGTVATPTFSPVAGTYGAAQSVAIATATAGAFIRYTLDGTDPTPATLLYTGLVTVDATATLKARAYKSDAVPSAIGSAAYTISGSVVAPPTFSPAGGYYPTQRTVTLSSATGGAIIHYTTDGSVPSQASASVASGDTVVVSQALRLRAKAYAAGYPPSPAPSPVRQADYRITGAVASGYDGALALKTDGILYSWGTNAHGTVGNGTTTPVNNPTAVSGMTTVVAIAARGYLGSPTVGESFAVKADGSLWGWGTNTNGQLGIGNQTSPQKSPVQVKDPPGTGFLTGVVAVSSGPNHTLALTSTGQVYGWGANSFGQAGTGGVVSPQTKPVLVTSLMGVIAIAAGDRHSVALKQDGSVWVWGYNFQGFLGTGSTTSPVLTPTQVPGIGNVVAIAAGPDLTLAIRADDSVSRSLWSWGDGTLAGGKLFDGAAVLRTVPGKVGAGVAVAAASEQTLVYRRETTGRGMIWGVGFHFADTLNTGASSTSTVPVHIADGELLAFSPGRNLSTAIKPDLTVLAWGQALGGNGFSLGNPGAFTADPDGDGLTTEREWEFDTDPFNSDTNGDGIPDGIEVAAGQSPTNPDIDGDGILNATERAQGTDPFRADTDGDGSADGVDCFPLDPTRWQCPTPTGGDVTPPVITLTEPTNATLISSVP